MDNAIIERINTLLVGEFEADETLLIPGAIIKTTLDLDSLDYIDLIALTESNFGCKITHEDFDNIITFQDLYDYITAHAKH
jgi:acyl carrier protein